MDNDRLAGADGTEQMARSRLQPWLWNGGMVMEVMEAFMSMLLVWLVSHDVRLKAGFGGIQ